MADFFQAKVSRYFCAFFSIFTQKVIHHFPAPIFPNRTMPRYPHKASYFEYRLCHKRLGLNLEISCTDNICDRVSSQSKKLKDAILVAFDRGKCGLENGVLLSGYR